MRCEQQQNQSAPMLCEQPRQWPLARIMAPLLFTSVACCCSIEDAGRALQLLQVDARQVQSRPPEADPEAVLSLSTLLQSEASLVWLTRSMLRIGLASRSDTLAWFLVLLSILIVVLLCFVVFCDASHQPFEVVPPRQAPVAAAPATAREPDRPVPPGAGAEAAATALAAAKTNRPVPKPRSGQDAATFPPVSSQSSSPMVVAHPIFNSLRPRHPTDADDKNDIFSTGFDQGDFEHLSPDSDSD